MLFSSSAGPWGIILPKVSPGLTAREAEPVPRMAVAAGMQVVVVTDELNTWAAFLRNFSPS